MTLPHEVVEQVEAGRSRDCGQPDKQPGAAKCPRHADRIAPPGEAAALIAAVSEGDRALWATAFYAGLRRGELQALDWSNVNLAAGVIRVEWAWDRKEGLIQPKSEAARRKVPIPAVVRDYLDEHKIRHDNQPGLVFCTSTGRPFDPPTTQRRADKTWKAADLKRITLHECRHTFASLMIDAMVEAGKFNPKALQVCMGHSSIQVTYDRYGHLFPGNEKEAAALLDAYLERANTKARAAAVQV